MDLRCVRDIFREVCGKFDVTSVTVRSDMRWACDQVDKDLKSAAKGDPSKAYHHLDSIAEMAGIAGSATPLMSPDGQPLMGRDQETGEEFPVLMADAKLLTVAIKARTAASALMGYRDSIKWKRSLAHQQVELAKTKTDLAREQLALAVRDREIEEERKALLAAKTSHGGMVFLQKPDQKVLDGMSRFLVTGKTELEGWILSHSQQEVEDAVDDDEGGVLGGDPEPGGDDPDDVPGSDAGERRGGDGTGNGSGG